MGSVAKTLMIAKYTLYVRKRSQQMAGVNLTSVKLMAQSLVWQNSA